MATGGDEDKWLYGINRDSNRVSHPRPGLAPF